MSKNIIIPSQEYLRICFDYKLSTGRLVWKARPLQHFMDERSWKIWNTRFAGTVVGAQVPRGHFQLGLNGTTYKVHRIIWKYIHGTEPLQIDHIDGDPSNNKIENLRSATNTQNNQNKKLTKLNKTGFKGVSFSKKYKVFIAQIKINGKNKHLGSCVTAEEAYQLYCAKAKELHGEFVNYGT